MRLACGADVDLVCAEAEGEDVLVVLAPGEHDRELHRGVVGVQRGDADAGGWQSLVGVAVADDGGGSGDRADDGVLQAEVSRRG